MTPLLPPDNQGSWLSGVGGWQLTLPGSRGRPLPNTSPEAGRQGLPHRRGEPSQAALPLN